MNLFSVPSRVVCLTEEPVETLYLLDSLDKVCGVSHYVRRPSQARLLPKVSHFIHMNLRKILDLRPDLVLGYSDLQADLAKELIQNGINIYIGQQRTLVEILNYILFLGRVFDKSDLAKRWVDQFQNQIQLQKEKNKGLPRPKVYFEEWDDPIIVGSYWLFELIEICGGDPILPIKMQQFKAQERVIKEEDILRENPDIIFLCWCGKSANFDKVYARKDFENINAIQQKQIFELPPEIFLQPGPALFIDGIKQMSQFIDHWRK